MKLRVLLVAVLVLLGLPLATQAATFTWTFSSPAGTVASPHTYFNDGTPTFFIIASSFKTANIGPQPSPGPTAGQTWAPGGTFDTGTITPEKLFGKTLGGDENGLGQDMPDEIGVRMTAAEAAEQEIEEFSFVQLDVKNLLDNNFTSLSLAIGSVQAGQNPPGQPDEGFYVWGSNTAGVPGTFLFEHLSSDLTFSVPQFGSFRYISVSATPHGPLATSPGESNVLIRDGSAAVQIPEPATLSLLALGGLGALLRRRLSK